MHCLIISVGYTFPPDYLWYRGSATADKVLKYYVIVLYFLYKMVFGMYIIARGGKSQLVLARPSCVFSGSSQIVISSWLGEPKNFAHNMIGKVILLRFKKSNTRKWINFGYFSKTKFNFLKMFWLEPNNFANTLWLGPSRIIWQSILAQLELEFFGSFHPYS